MLTPKEKMLVEELLSALTLDDLLMIAKTTTNHVMNPTNKEEALQIITSHEEDLRTLLHRRKVTKVLLFNYLHWKKVTFPGNADKAQLVEIVIKLCRSLEACGESPKMLAGNEFSSHSNVSPLLLEPSYQRLTDYPGTLSNLVQPSVPEQQLSIGTNPGWVTAMSFKFIEWFYSLVNEERNNSTLTEEDFWSDAIVHIKILCGNDVTTLNATSSHDAVIMIREIKRGHNLQFLPNISEQGVIGKLDPHGIVLVGACGTLFRTVNECVGVFEQIFSLIRDPLNSDNWKIKRTDLNIRIQCNTIEPPSLKDGEFFEALVRLNNP